MCVYVSVASTSLLTDPQIADMWLIGGVLGGLLGAVFDRVLLGYVCEQ